VGNSSSYQLRVLHILLFILSSQEPHQAKRYRLVLPLFQEDLLLAGLYNGHLLQISTEGELMKLNLLEVFINAYGYCFSYSSVLLWAERLTSK